MKVNLVYVNSGMSVDLKSMGLKEMDQYTNQFVNELEMVDKENFAPIIGQFLYDNEKYIDESDEGKVMISYQTADLPIREMDKFTLESHHLNEKHYLHPIYKEDLLKPDQLYIIAHIKNRISDEKTNKKVRDCFSINGDIDKWFKDISTGEEGYFFTRVVDEVVNYYEDEPEKGNSEKEKPQK